ncbi:serine/threonine protein kinase [Streptomyces zhihengii]|uniref:serine/threonine protein kinase n=1 Tax=Streptomyces zhihengii TaxID=1818004 RepID=UPI0033A28C32
MRGAVLDERYVLTERLGRGGMGQVWSARDERMQREVAVKLVTAVPDAGDEETFHRFQREIRSAANLPGRHTVTAHDCGEAVIDDEPYLYMVMERLTGRTLAQEIRLARPPWRTAVRWGYQVAAALHAAHTLRIVHRDIKPENVMFAADGDVKVLDFGIAKFLGDTAARAGGFTRTGVPMGTLLYMSPEQARGDTAVDHRTDLYSLGCLLYFMLTGRPPMVADNVLALVYMHAEADIPPPHTLVPEIPSGLSGLVAQLLQRRPEDRPESAGAVLEQLKELATVRHRGGTTLPVLTGDRAGAEAEIAAKLAGAQEIYQASIRDARAREEEAEAALLAARGQADELRTRAADEAGAVRAEAERHRVDLRHRTEQEIVALRTRAERDVRDLRAEADALMEATRRKAAQADAEFEASLAKRREQTERDLTAQRATAQKRVVELEHRAQQLSAEAELLRTEAEERARRTVQSAQLQVENVLQDGNARVTAARAEAERAMNALAELRERLARMLADSRFTPLDDLTEQRAEILGRLTSLQDALADTARRHAAAHGYAYRDDAVALPGAAWPRRPRAAAEPEGDAPENWSRAQTGETDTRSERVARTQERLQTAMADLADDTAQRLRSAARSEGTPESEVDRTEGLRRLLGPRDGSVPPRRTERDGDRPASRLPRETDDPEQQEA